MKEYGLELGRTIVPDLNGEQEEKEPHDGHEEQETLEVPAAKEHPEAREERELVVDEAAYRDRGTWWWIWRRKVIRVMTPRLWPISNTKELQQKSPYI